MLWIAAPLVLASVMQLSLVTLWKRSDKQHVNHSMDGDHFAAMPDIAIAFIAATTGPNPTIVDQDLGADLRR